MKRITKLCIILLAVAALFGCQKQQKQTEDIYIVFTSDVHCGFEDNIPLPSLKAYVDSVKSEHKDALLLDCGDYLQGGTIGTLSKGQFVIDLMNEVGYDIVTVGNHEFDYGMDRLSDLLGQLKSEVVLSNVKYTGTKGNIFQNTPEYIIKELNGVKVGFIGLLIPTAPVSSTPSLFMEGDEFVYDFYSGNEGQDLFNRTQEVVDEVRKQGVKYVVALSHLGSTAKAGVYNVISMIANTEGIDIVLDGHSHSVIAGDLYPNKNGEDVLLCSVGTKLEYIGTVIIDTEGKFSSVLISEYNETDENTAAALEKVKGELNVILSEKITEVDFDLPISDEEGVRITRSRETTTGDLVADAFRHAYDAQIGIVNGGSVRKTILAGDVTYGNLLDVVPFQNTMGVINATGQNILDYLEFCCMKTDKIYKLDGNAVGEFGGFAQVSGLKYTIDTSKDAQIQYDENQLFAGFGSEERRVKDVYVLEGDEYVPIDPEKIYTVCSSSYLLFEPGDGNNILNDCEPLVTEGIMDVTALRNYVEEFGIGDEYRTTQGRITVE
ncbi:MAG: bifunctional metallophosphatase/5'-nucleotidase [Erysipelotrichaceae bacterium]|nr:bifunctional metallophosphatase/5'-nucleotidase [Erysipelotrichaceae bacterium]